jgi:mxaJ protein
MAHHATRFAFRPRVGILLPAAVAVLALLLFSSCRSTFFAQPSSKRVLRVCSDPNNLPFSNQAGEGFENKIAELLARKLNATVQYTWRPQRRGFIRNTLSAKACDVVIGIPSGSDMVLTTNPYYRSSYVFVTRRDSGIHVASFDSPVLRTARIGVQLIGDDYTNTPPAHALARRGIVKNVVGFRVAGDYAEANPPARLIEAVANGTVDVAIAWGPLAGYFAKKERVALEFTSVSPQQDSPQLPFAFDVSMGVRRGDVFLQKELNAFLAANKAEITAVLAEYGVPLVK